MYGLTLHCGSKLATLDQVRCVPTPEPTETHFPVPHASLFDAVEEYLPVAGFTLAETAHALSRDGARYFGLMRIVGRDDNSALEGKPRGHGLVLGLRNTHDRAWSLALALGSHVFVCDNLSFSGEVLLGRKHTRYIARDVPLLLPRAFEALSLERVKMEDRIDAYKRSDLSDKDANDLIVRSIVDDKVFPASDVSRIVRQWRKPAHEEFEPRTAWSLFNAYTEVAKNVQNPATLAQRTNRLHGFFDRELGLFARFEELKRQRELKRQTILTGGDSDFVTKNDAWSR